MGSGTETPKKRSRAKGGPRTGRPRTKVPGRVPRTIMIDGTLWRAFREAAFLADLSVRDLIEAKIPEMIRECESKRVPA